MWDRLPACHDCAPNHRLEAYPTCEADFRERDRRGGQKYLQNGNNAGLHEVVGTPCAVDWVLEILIWLFACSERTASRRHTECAYYNGRSSKHAPAELFLRIGDRDHCGHDLELVVSQVAGWSSDSDDQSCQHKTDSSQVTGLMPV